MIDKSIIADVVGRCLAESDAFVVDISVSRDNDIVVLIDSPEGIDIELCETLTRAIEAAVPREPEDYSLEVGSAGLTAPFTVRGQYLKNIGNRVEVLTADGRKFSGTLTEVDDGEWPDFGFTVQIERKVRLEGKKRPETVLDNVRLTPSQVKTIRYDIDFK